MHRSLLLIPTLATVVSASGCASLNKKETGAIIGAASGAAVGGMVGRANGSTAKGAIIGAAVGGTAGAVIGHQMDQQAKEIHQNIPGATVARVGEGMDVTFNSEVLFAPNSDVLNEQARSNLTSLAQSLQKYPNTNVLIVGHTDSTGSESRDMSLSKRRAMATERYLASQGVARSRMRAEGRGASEPVAPNDTEADRQRNRRVEVAIYASDEFKRQAKAQ